MKMIKVAFKTGDDIKLKNYTIRSYTDRLEIKGECMIGTQEGTKSTVTIYNRDNILYIQEYDS